MTLHVERASADIGIGLVEGIFTASAPGMPIVAHERILAIAGVGLEGDRYARQIGHYSDDDKVDRDITLIEAEEIERLATAGIELRPGETRRNVTTRGIRLNDLVGRRFRIGAVECLGTKLCEPCLYLAELLDKPILAPLVHRGGLRARILTGGELVLGDELVALD